MRKAAPARRTVTSAERTTGPACLPSDRMTAQRSYENAEMGQQLYALLESIKKPEALWAKLATEN
jgi:hypothetical protein